MSTEAPCGLELLEMPGDAGCGTWVMVRETPPVRDARLGRRIGARAARTRALAASVTWLVGLGLACASPPERDLAAPPAARTKLTRPGAVPRPSAGAPDDGPTSALTERPEAGPPADPTAERKTSPPANKWDCGALPCPTHARCVDGACQIVAAARSTDCGREAWAERERVRAVNCWMDPLCHHLQAADPFSSFAPPPVEWPDCEARCARGHGPSCQHLALALGRQQASAQEAARLAQRACSLGYPPGCASQPE